MTIVVSSHFPVGFVLLLTPLMFRVLKRIEVQSYQLSLNCWRILGDVTFLNLILSLEFGIDKLFHLYPPCIKDVWFNLFFASNTHLSSCRRIGIGLAQQLAWGWVWLVDKRKLFSFVHPSGRHWTFFSACCRGNEHIRLCYPHGETCCSVKLTFLPT